MENSNQYYCALKEKFSLLLMAISKAERKFIWFDISCRPTTHDSLAWLMKDLGQSLENCELPYPAFILVKSAITWTLSMITPVKEDDFNFEQSSLRFNVECAFGQLIRRCVVLWRPLEMQFRKKGAVLGCCIRLHNYWIDCLIDLEEELAKKWYYWASTRDLNTCSCSQ